jgi:hypothetical protein
MRVKRFKIFYIFNNMDNIIEPNSTFDFSKMSLAHPVGIQGGAYFTKIEHNMKPLYIQTCKSQTRQGFVKTGKKYYCDLMFDKNAEFLINWFENLEEKCKKLIYEKKDLWFQNSLEESDIDTAFNSVIRIYKSGKYYLARTNLRHNNITNLPNIKIFDENEIPLKMEDINSDTNIISILEIQGIKFTSRNFQIEIELKQVMVLNNEPIFESCLIKTNKSIKQPIEEINNNLLGIVDASIDRNDYNNNDYNDNNHNNNHNNDYNNKENNIVIDTNNVLEDIDNINISDNISSNIFDNNLGELEPLDIIANKDVDDTLEIIAEDLDKEDSENPNELKEVDIDKSLDNSNAIQLKKPNQVYFEIYREARNKAKVAKKNAILAYLEAKNIKKTYMLESMDESESEFDAEIDDVSESELEGL